MIFLFDDFGWQGPYTGQMKTVLAQRAAGIPVVDLQHDAPAFRPRAAGRLLAALVPWLPAGAVVLAVVDPGVGTERRPCVVEADGRWFVGPDNGLFGYVMQQAASVQAWCIDWRPDDLSASFHGRDLFAPVAAMLATGQAFPRSPIGLPDRDIPPQPDLAEVIYIDGYGNAMTGLRAGAVTDAAIIRSGEQAFRRARTFGEVPPGEGLWYANSLGLVELAVNQGSAAARFGLAVGMPVRIEAVNGTTESPEGRGG